MIDHTGVTSAHIAAATAFYDAAFAALGGAMRYEVPKEFTGGAVVRGYGRERAQFWLSEATGARQATSPNHVAFEARSRAEVDAFHAAAVAAGGRDNGKPGLRPHYHADYFGAFVVDPDGNNIEAVCHAPA